MKKTILSIVATCLVLSACTPMQRFTRSTKNIADFQLSGGPTAKVRLTTNEDRVFATPNSDCVDLSLSGLINNEDPSKKRKDNSRWSFKPQPIPTKEFITQDLGVKGISVDQLKQNGYRLYGSSYISKDMEVNAGKPITIFIPRMNDSVNQLFSKGSIYTFGFGLSFTPEAGHQYQLILDTGSTTNTVRYRANLFDVTGDIPINYNRFAQRLKACKKAKRPTE